MCLLTLARFATVPMRDTSRKSLGLHRPHAKTLNFRGHGLFDEAAGVTNARRPCAAFLTVPMLDMARKSCGLHKPHAKPLISEGMACLRKLLVSQMQGDPVYPNGPLLD
eukprot:s2411_g9.t1